MLISEPHHTAAQPHTHTCILSCIMCRNGQSVGVAFYDVQVRMMCGTECGLLSEGRALLLHVGWQMIFTHSPRRAATVAVAGKASIRHTVFACGLTVLCLGCHCVVCCAAHHRSSSCTRVWACAPSMRRCGPTLVERPSVWTSASCRFVQSVRVGVKCENEI